MVAMNEWKKKCVGLQRTWVSKRTVELVVGLYLLNPQTWLDPLKAEWRVGQRVRALDKTGMSVKLVCHVRWPTCPCRQGCYQVISAPPAASWSVLWAHGPLQFDVLLHDSVLNEKSVWKAKCHNVKLDPLESFLRPSLLWSIVSTIIVLKI